MINKKAKNSWGEVADWYQRNLENSNSYQNMVILPNIIRLLDLSKTDQVLDLACGEGFFETYIENDCKLTAIDISNELVAIAKNKCKNTQFHVAKAENIDQLNLVKFDKILTILALQNIEDLNKTVKNISKLMNDNSTWHIVINHPYYRQLRHSNWQFDTEKNIQFRTVDKYLTNYKTIVEMNPSKANSSKTITYHRSMQEYIKIMKNNNLALINLEEWISHIDQDQGNRTVALEKAKKEIPMFMYLCFSKKIKP